MANSNSHENNGLQYPQGLIPGLNYMPAAFQMPANGELPQGMMHPLQQLGAMPFFGQGGGQFLMPTSGMPVFLHPGFPGAMQVAQGGNMASPNSMQSSQQQQQQQGRDGGGGSRTGTPQQSADAARLASGGGQMDGGAPPPPFPGMFPQQLQFFSHLPQLYMQPSMHQLSAAGGTGGEQSLTALQNAQDASAMTAFGNSASAFPEGFAGMSMPGFPIPVAFPGMAPAAGVQQLNVAPQQQAAPAQQKEDPTKGLKPPKRPLTPYMRFSKAMWTTVKSSYPDMTVCEIGATIGRLWRELASDQKEKYNEEFSRDKVRYDDELQQYLKVTGLQASDVNKPAKKKKESASKSSASHGSSNRAHAASQQQAPPPMPPQQQQQQQAAAAGLLMTGQPSNGGPGVPNPWLM